MRLSLSVYNCSFLHHSAVFTACRSAALAACVVQRYSVVLAACTCTHMHTQQVTSRFRKHQRGGGLDHRDHRDHRRRRCKLLPQNHRTTTEKCCSTTSFRFDSLQHHRSTTEKGCSTTGGAAAPLVLGSGRRNRLISSELR